ncbi:MAG TPA: mannonate dehydratase [Chthonomonadaceae bacterium]|nr:mannonate dehydratase [Chthonomonadaceae bacterium]
MNRRQFLAAGAASIPAAAAARPARAAQRARRRPAVKMKAGNQGKDTPEALRVLAALGINHICSTLPSRSFDANWSVEGLSRLRDQVESFGVKLEMVPLPMSSLDISKAEMPAIMLAKDPERDREIDQICKMIENCSKAGIPAVKYNLTLLGVPRTASTKGRGGARYSTFVYDQAKQDTLTEAGRVDAEMMWDRITYFLKRVAPVAEANRVRICCHPNDPGMPKVKGFRGVDCVLGTVDGLKRFVTIAENPYHGLNFCQGTICEMLEDPNREIGDIIRWFGTRRKIFNVHFRNIKGKFLNFQETFPDCGDVNMLEALRVYRDVGYDGMIMPDHVPKIEGDTAGAQAFAFAFGYIQALLQVVGQEA